MALTQNFDVWDVDGMYQSMRWRPDEPVGDDAKPGWQPAVDEGRRAALEMMHQEWTDYCRDRRGGHGT